MKKKRKKKNMMTRNYVIMYEHFLAWRIEGKYIHVGLCIVEMGPRAVAGVLKA